MNNNFIDISYGNETLAIQVPGGYLVEQVAMRSVKPAQNPMPIVDAALDAPIGCPPLLELAHGATNVVIVTDDNTRPTPVHLILPRVLTRLLNAGIASERIEILIASGTHRPMTERELEAKLGKEIIKTLKYPIIIILKKGHWLKWVPRQVEFQSKSTERLPMPILLSVLAILPPTATVAGLVGLRSFSQGYVENQPPLALT